MKSLKKPKFYLHYGDVTDGLNISELVNKIGPDEIYNLATQSHVQVSFETPEYTANADALGVLRILEAIRRYKKKNKILSGIYIRNVWKYKTTSKRANLF